MRLFLVHNNNLLLLAIASTVVLLLQLQLPEVVQVFVFVQAASEEERLILRELYDTTNGHAWNENDGWAHNTKDVCTWTGVTCGGEISNSEGLSNNPIIGLNLQDNFLTGRTPSNLWKLSSLTSLDLGYNPSLDIDFSSLYSSVIIPQLETVDIRQTATTSVTGIFRLSESLTRLILTENKFESQFPSDIFALNKLTTLHMNGCSLRGSIPDTSDSDDGGNGVGFSSYSGGYGISQLNQLRELDLYENDFTGTVPSGLDQLVHLRKLILSKNQFHGTIPDYFNTNFVMLEELWISFNDLTGSIPAFDMAPKIQKLYLNGNSFTGLIPDTFLAATLASPDNNNNNNEESIKINLSKNEFSGTIPESLDRLSALNIVWRLGDNKWTDISETLCDNYNWNDGGVGQFGCNGLICPPGRYSAAGYHTQENPCEVCDTAEYYGTFACFDQDDRAVLLDVYAKLGGANWYNNTGWSTAPRQVADDDWSEEWMDYCQWYGVECWDLGDAKDGRVRKVTLPNNNLKGMMPETIFAIEHMTILDVSNNEELTVSFYHVGRSEHIYSINVGGTKTKDYDGIQHAQDFFKILYADNTPISGTIPGEITRMHNLHILSLQNSDLNGELPSDLFAMSSLRELYLSNNNFQGVLPDRWESLEGLEILSLAKNAFRGNLPESFGLAPKLRAISLMDQVTKGGGLTGSVPSFSKSRSLTQLIVGANKLDGTLPEDLLIAVDPLESLFHVDITNNMISGTVHGSYDRFEKMDLYLEGNLISSIDDGLCNNLSWMSGGVGSYGCDAILCPVGTSNYGGRRQFTNDGCTPCNDRKETSTGASYLGQSSCSADPSSFSSSTSSSSSIADATATIDATATANTAAERSILELLYDQTGGSKSWKSSNEWKTETSVCTWYGINCDENGSVASIQLGSNGLRGSMPTEIFSLPNLVHLKMYGNDLDVDFTGIENARNLQTLGLDDTGLTSLDGIGKARSLIELNVRYNKLNGDLPEELSKLVNLLTLDISHNKFSGPLPFWMKNLASLTSFTASNNNLSGSVLDFASLSKLSYLDLSYNQFEGTVPPTLLASSPPDDKVVVNLSHNKIEGVVPADLSRLYRLSIQLQENEISGIDEDLCKTDGVNDFDALSFGCNGILCPVGTWNSLGRQSNEDVPCEPCKKAKFMGTTNCGGSSDSAISKKPTVILGLIFGVGISWMML